MNDKFKINSNFVIRNIKDEIILLNMKTGDFYSSSEIGKIIIEGIKEGQSINEIKEKITNEYEITNKKKFETDFTEFLNDLLKEKIIKKI